MLCSGCFFRCHGSAVFGAFSVAAFVAVFWTKNRPRSPKEIF
jgi:hypothetical protein